MINIIEGVFPKLSFSDVITLKAESLYNIYGRYPDLFLSWCQYVGDKPTAVIMFFGGAAAVSCSENADADEIKTFLKTLCGNECFCTPQFLKLTGAGVLKQYRVMELINPPENGGYGEETKPHTFSDVYGALSSGSDGDIELPSFDDWYVDFSHRVRHGAARYVLSDASVAITTAQTKTAALIGGVATHPTFRGKGGAKAVLLSLCAKLCAEKKRVFVISGESNIEFYQKCGFKEVDNYYLAIL